MAKAAPSPAPAGAASAGTTPPMSVDKTAAPARSESGGLKAWLPTIAVIVLAPVCTWAVGQFVLIPQLQKKLLATPAGEAASAEAQTEGAHGEKDGKGGKDAATYEFQNVVVNLAGTMGTRYLKTSFLVTGAEPNIKSVFETNKPRLTDVTLNVLSSLSLADLEEPGAKNVLREKLVAAYNQALGRKVAEQVYFSDFVVQ
ncbi:MAG TPA: flagellar basal body-associated FliL family protein [Opitutus sp.]|nr:flagellar basal body-associated FliL family protein [Opitutus sp.]